MNFFRTKPKEGAPAQDDRAAISQKIEANRQAVQAAQTELQRLSLQAVHDDDNRAAIAAFDRLHKTARRRADFGSGPALHHEEGLEHVEHRPVAMPAVRREAPTVARSAARP